MLRGQRIYSKHLKSQAQTAKKYISTGTNGEDFHGLANRKRFGFVHEEAVNDSESIHGKKMTNLLDTNAWFSAKMGTCMMNRHHKYNIFTKKYADQLNRVCTSLEYAGDDISCIHFGSNDPTTFSRGTDIKTLQYHQANKDMDPIVDYFNSLYNFQTGFARTNKPLILTAQGNIQNSAACLVGSAGIPCVTHDANFVFNETSARNRLTPHAGASYYLTRMPGELGTFLALTGTPFNGSEAKEILGLADFIMSPSEEFKYIMNRNLKLIDNPIWAEDLYGTDGIKENVHKYKYEAMHRYATERYLNEKKHRQFSDHTFIAPWDAKKLEAEKGADKVDLEYKRYLRENLYHKALHDFTKLGSGATGHYLNHYKHVADYVKSILPTEESDLTGSILRRYERDINRCFYANTMEEIVENLKKENTKFSRYCLQRFEENDQVALNVTLALLRKAERMSYSECCHAELKANLNLLKNENNVDANTPMTKELLESYFETPKEYQYVDLTVKDHAPLPTRKYYDKYADHMRLLMNEHSSMDMAIREGYDREVQSELREVGIDIRDSGLTPQIIRTSLWNKELVDRKKEHEDKIHNIFFNDDKLSERYYTQVAEHIELLSSEGERWSDTHTDYYSLVNDLTQKCFADAFMKNIEVMTEKSKDVHKIKKKRFLLRLKKFFFENRLLDTQDRRDFIERLRAENLPRVPLSFSDNIYDNIYDAYDKHGPLKTQADIDRMKKKKKSFTEMELKTIPERQRKRRLEINNGVDPVNESKYYPEYEEMKQRNKEFEERFTKRQEQREKAKQEYLSAKSTYEQEIDKESAKIVNDLINNEYDSPIYETIKKMQENTKQKLEQRLQKSKARSKSYLNKRPEAKEQFEELTKKISDMSLGNALDQRKLETNEDQPKSKLEQLLNKYSDAKRYEYMNGVLMENYKPAYNITMKNVLEEEAREILHAFNYQENMTSAAIQLEMVKHNPGLMKQNMFLKFVKDQYKDVPEIQQLLEKRPTNSAYYKGMSNGEVYQKVSRDALFMVNEDPIKALKTMCESISTANFDITHGDPKQMEKIQKNLEKYADYHQDPIRDVAEYGLHIAEVAELLRDEPEIEQEVIDNCTKLLKKIDSENANDELQMPYEHALQAMEKAADSKTSALARLEAEESRNAQKMLQDFLDSSCDEQSLKQVRDTLKENSASKDINKVLKYISENLQHTAEARRKNITIKEYLENDSTLSLDFLSNVSDSVLKGHTKKVGDRNFAYKENGVEINSIDLLSKEDKHSLYDTIPDSDQIIVDRNTYDTYFIYKDEDTLLNEKLKADLENAAKMSEDLEHTRAKFENDIMELFTTGVDCQDKINEKVQQWIDLRITDLKTKPEYKEFSNTEYKPLVVERLKEQICEELGLNSDNIKLREFEDFNPLNPAEKNRFSNDIANKTNLNHVMENALGYDNLIERLQTPEKSSDLAQSNYAEKMLAEYYIDKRKDYKASKDILDALNKEFKSVKYYDQTKRIGEELDIKNGQLEGYTESGGLKQFHQLMKRNQEEVEMLPEDTMQLIELGNATNHAIDGETQGVAESLLKYREKANEWPEIYPKYDMRRDPKEWVEEKLYDILSNMFEARSKVEKNMTRNELKTYDKELINHLDKGTMIQRLLHELDQEYAELVQKRLKTKYEEQERLDKEVQASKHQNEQGIFNRKIKNIDAAYKLIAYRIARKYHPDRDVRKPDSAFEYYYDKQLQRDIEIEPRPVNERDYRPKAPVEEKPMEDEDSYYEGYELYKKDRKGMYDRIEIYYILEQYRHKKEYNDLLEDKQKKLLKEYFDDMTNIQFFENNKIK